MKALFFYNPHSGPDMALKAAVEAEGLHVECIDIMSDTDNPFKRYIRATPALVTITDDTQGEFLNRPDVDDVAYIRAMLAQTQESEEKVIHDMATNRLDNMVNGEKAKAGTAAVDEYTIELMKEGVL